MNSPVAVALVYLISMILAVPIAKRLGLGAILGYLIAGCLLGRHALGLVVGDDSEVMHLAEFGVIMMLFLIGLELRPAVLWKMRGPIFGLGGAQVVLTAGAFAGLARAVGLPWQSAVAVGLTFASSSTAIVVRTLQDKGALKTDGGEAAFAVLLFQDIAVIPILALFSLLASSLTGASHNAAEDLPVWLQSLRLLGAVLGVILAGKWVVRPVFRLVLGSHIHELTTALGLVVVLATSALMTYVGLSPALGAFLAGVVLAESEYRHQLESDIEPFKALLLAIFFISVGAQINFTLVRENLGATFCIVGAIVIVKFAILYFLGRVWRYSRPDAWLVAVSLAQGGEFAFVLMSQASKVELLPQSQTQILVAAIALSMALAPLLLNGYFKWVAPRFASSVPEREADAIDQDAPVIVAGIGRFGQMITRFLKAAGHQVTILDYDAEQVELLRRFGTKSFYGDASRMDLLRSAGIERARLLVLAIDDKDKTLEIVQSVRQAYPGLRILARAYDRVHAYELIHRGVDDVYVETSGSALEMARDALVYLGTRKHRAQILSQQFKKHNNQSIRELARVYHESDEQTFVAHAKNWIAALEKTLQSDKVSVFEGVDHGWESAPRKET